MNIYLKSKKEKMKKINLKNVKNSLTRDEMRLITGGGQVMPPGCYTCGYGCQYMSNKANCENGDPLEPCGLYGNCDL